MNATYGGYLLSPLLEYQDVSNFSLPYAAQDLGWCSVAPRQVRNVNGI